MSEHDALATLLPPSVAGYRGTLVHLREKQLAPMLDALTEERQAFLGKWQHGRRVTDSGRAAFFQALCQGMLPSAYADKALTWLRDGGFVPAEHWPVLLDAMDRVLEQPYAMGWERRSYRSLDRAAYIDRLQRLVREFVRDVLLPFDLVDLLTGHVPETVTEFMSKTDLHPTTALSARIACALDHQDAAVEAAIRDMIDGDGKPFFMGEVIRGILWSHRSDMHEMLGRLLVAARLQEGLRQFICENADMGSPAAFCAMVDVIARNDLIRFSSVKRAVGVWLGLIAEESADLTRISGKTIDLIARCMRDEAAVKECLSSEDSMQIHIGLWAVGVRDVRAAVECAGQLALHGRHHQRLTAGYFAAGLNLPAFEEALAKKVLLAFPDELDTVAVYLPRLMASGAVTLHKADQSSTEPAWRETFSDEAEARRFHALFLSIRSRISKKLVFDPCVFPWHKATLEKGDLSERICVLARWLDDDQLIDGSIPLFTECDAGRRQFLLTGCYGRMRTPRQRAIVLSSVCDKAEFTRTTAIELVEGMSLTDEDNAVLETLLRYKYGDARQAVIRWLMRQADDALFGTISRLLGDARSEERRMAALDIIKQLADEGTRKALIDRCIPLVTGYDQPTTKEKTLLDGLLAKFGTSARAEEALFTEADVYQPVIEDTPLSAQALQTYMRYFPASEVADMLDGRKKGFVERILQHKGDELSPVQADLDSLQACYAWHAEDLVKDRSGEDALLCNLMMLPVEQGRIVLQESWDAWYAEQVQAPERLMRLHILLCAGADNGAARVIKAAFGNACQQGKLPQQAGTLVHMRQITAHLMEEHVPAEDRKLLASALLRWLAQCVPDEQLWCEMKGSFGIPLSPLLNDTRLSALLIKLDHRDEAHLRTNFPAGMLLARRFRQAWQKHSSHMVQRGDGTVMYSGNGYAGVTTYRSCIEWSMRSGILPDLYHLLHAGYHGLISREGLYAWLMTDGFPRDASRIFGALADGGQRFTSRYAYNYYGGTRFREDCLNRYLGKSKPETDEDAALLKYAADIWAPLLRRIIEAEITRGDTATAYSAFVPGLQRIWGAKNFIAILSALGKDKFARGTFYLSGANGRTESLCRMLSVCVPAPEDTADGLRALVRQYKVSDKRLIEAALYSPEWIELVEDAIALPGFRSAAYYFIAHMNEECDGIRAARIARFTPLAVEELQNGAFDIGWFRSAWTEVGESAFDMIYDAAKYITSGAKHARARKYADAALGRMETAAAKAEISQKRNKDLLMAYALIPLTGEDDLQARYLYIQQFLKESRGYGAQRAASEKTAAETALTNLAMNAGYADSMRLTLRMETRLVADNSELFVPRDIGEISVCLTVDELGGITLNCRKDGKALKSIPAKYKKNEYILRLNDMKKQLLEQQRRARRMLEDAMEASTAFTAAEIASLLENPVIAPMLRSLVFMQGDRFGFAEAMSLTAADGTAVQLQPDDALIVAHPLHLWQARVWLPFQRRIYAERIVQPFRQVFRELYIKTPDEMGREVSLRYAGHQIQPARVMGCLKGRRWIADAEAGLQKVYYKENIVATIWAMADWFTPSDIEAPTLEWVAFLDRKTGVQMKIDDVPEIIFSEVMRDVDLAVSVAHAGQVDPESSHSTMEMRAALLSFTLPMFRLNNVVIRDHHAIITGTLARYSVHLGSGVVHQLGGTMLAVLPVHSQHCGRIFLPFVDDDPKTAEIISKVLLFAEDDKIKDPAILAQIQRE